MNDLLQPHIRCGIKDAAKYAILPGDPKRVERTIVFAKGSVILDSNTKQ